jgi:hypothetical protein
VEVLRGAPVSGSRIGEWVLAVGLAAFVVVVSGFALYVALHGSSS